MRWKATELSSTYFTFPFLLRKQSAKNMHTNTQYVRAYRERQKQHVRDLQAEIDRLRSEIDRHKIREDIIQHNLTVRTREAGAVWNQINQIDAALCVALGRQWKYEELPPPGTAGGAFIIARQLYDDQIKPLPDEDPSST